MSDTVKLIRFIFVPTPYGMSCKVTEKKINKWPFVGVTRALIYPNARNEQFGSDFWFCYSSYYIRAVIFLNIISESYSYQILCTRLL